VQGRKEKSEDDAEKETVNCESISTHFCCEVLQFCHWSTRRFNTKVEDMATLCLLQLLEPREKAIELVLLGVFNERELRGYRRSRQCALLALGS
jgi:hypothetical protein